MKNASYENVVGPYENIRIKIATGCNHWLYHSQFPFCLLYTSYWYLYLPSEILDYSSKLRRN